MIIYLIVFALSCFFTALAQRCLKKMQKGEFLTFSIIAIILPVMLAALRDPGVGTDSAGYCTSIWSAVLQYRHFDVLMNLFNNDFFPEVERIYLITNWLVSLFSEDIHTLFFVLNLLVIGFIYKAAYDNRHKAEMWQVMLLFQILFYSNSLNLIRQYIAVAIGTYAYKFLEKHDWKKLIFWTTIMFMWHSTTIVFIALIFIDLLFNIQNKKAKKLVTAGICISMYILYTQFDNILIFTVNQGIIPSRFTAYLKQYSDETFLDTSSTLFSVIILFFYLYLLVYLKNKQNKPELKKFFIYKSIATFLNLTSLISKFLFRMSYFFSNITDCIFLPRALFMLKQKSKSRYYIFSLSFVFLSIALWYFLYVKNGINQTVPYKSSILGIE